MDYHAIMDPLNIPVYPNEIISLNKYKNLKSSVTSTPSFSLFVIIWIMDAAASNNLPSLH
ncbi:MAG: hypothetical protein WAM14_02710 [Candidatus Nitrosopolaris sp.]